MKPLLVVGDALLDRDVSGAVTRICPDAPVPVLDERLAEARPGGAALAAMLAASDGREVTLLSALGRDPAAGLLARMLAGAGVEVIDLGLDGATPEKVRLRSGGQSLLRLDRGGPPAPVGRLSAAARAAIGWAEAILVSDYGRELTEQPQVRAALASAASEKPLVWDPHARGAAPVANAELVTPNQQEAEAFAPAVPPAQRPAFLVDVWRAWHVCVTQGASGATLSDGGPDPRSVPAPQIGDGDPCGAGDRFASAAAGALADGKAALDAVREGVAQASAFVALGGAAALAHVEGRAAPAGVSGLNGVGGALATDLRSDETETAPALAALVRAAGGTVVAAGGCFDLLHAGHVGLLSAARQLGDCLIVCLNSDASVRRLKGPSRPVVGEQDRAAVLRALECVDAVAVFEQDTPVRLIERLKPDVWAKGGDYSARELPERKTLATWGGRVVTLPYLDGHSTTGLLQEVTGRVAG